MKNYFKNILAAGITIIFLGGHFTFALEEKPLLTLEESIKAGITYSQQVSLNVQEKELIRERLKANYNNAYEVYQSIYLEQAKSENQAQVLIDRISYDIASRYNKQIILEKELAFLEHAITHKTKELQKLKAKMDARVISPMLHYKAELELQELKNSRKALNELGQHEQSYFKLVTGKDLSKHTLEDTLHFEPFRISGDPEHYISSVIEAYIKYDQDIAQFAKDHIIIGGSAPILYTDYLERKYAADKGLAAVEDARKVMKDTLMKSYSSLIDMEEQITALDIKLALLQKQEGIAKVKYEAGRMTEADYQRESIKLESVKLEQYKLIGEYDRLRQIIEKPWKIGV